MTLAVDCRCGHPGRRHFMRKHGDRSGACMDKGCHCRSFGLPVAAPTVAHDPMRQRPITPPRRQV